MHIRNFDSEEDYKQSISLRKYIFSSTYTKEKEMDYHWLLRKGTGIGAFNDEQLLGQLINLPLELNFYGSQIKAVGINHVGVYPENRSKGIAHNLVKASLKKAFQSEQLVAMLQPFSVEFYRRFGYDLYTQRIRYCVPTDKFPIFKEKTDNHIKVKRYIAHDHQKILKNIEMFYQKISLKINGMQLRDRDWWQRLYQQNPNLNYVVLEDSDEIRGYVSYNIVGTRMFIVDFLAEDNVCRRELWNFLSAHQSNVFNIVGISSFAKSISYDFMDPRIEQEIMLNTMLRIVDVKRILELWVQRHIIREEFEVTIHDGQLIENNGYYRITNQGVIKETPHNNGEQVTTKELASILFGPLNVEQLNFFLDVNSRPYLKPLIQLAQDKEPSHFLGEF